MRALRGKITEVSVGFIIALSALALVIASDGVIRQYKLSAELTTPVTDWITIDNYEIDARNADSPKIIFERSVTRDLQNTWTIAVIENASGTIVCTGQGSEQYLMAERHKFILNLYDATNNKTCLLHKNTEYSVESNILVSDPNTSITKSLVTKTNDFFLGR